MKLENTLFWHDAGGCHWCERNTDSMTEGHDGMCPVPLLVLFEERVAQLEAENALYQQRITFEQACRFADAQNDYDLAAYALRDLPLTKSAELADLAQAMQRDGCSKGDWDGLKGWWDEAYRKAIKDLEDVSVASNDSPEG